MQNGQNEATSNDDVIAEKTNTPLLLVMAGVSFSLLVILMLMSGNKTAQAFDESKLLVTQNTNVEVMSITLQSQYVKPRVVFGQIESLQQSDIGFEFAGLLDAVIAPEGANVQKGDVLATLDTARLQARKNELQSALENAKANSRIAQISQTRVKELVAKKLEPQQRLDEAEAQLDASQAAVSEAQARLSSLQVDIQKSTLVAPFNGQIVRQYIDEGTVLNPGQAVFSILAKRSLEARFGLPEQTAFGVRVGQEHLLKMQNTAFSARVKFIATQRNMATRTIDAVFSIDINDLSPAQQQGMVTGDLVSLTVDIPVQKTGTWVPVSALASAVRGLWTLYVVDDQQQIQTRLVSVEYADDTKAYVTGAIQDGDKLVVSGIHRLTPMQVVNKVVEVDSRLAFASFQANN